MQAASSAPSFVQPDYAEISFNEFLVQLRPQSSSSYPLHSRSQCRPSKHVQPDVDKGFSPRSTLSAYASYICASAALVFWPEVEAIRRVQPQTASLNAFERPMTANGGLPVFVQHCLTSTKALAKRCSCCYFRLSAKLNMGTSSGTYRGCVQSASRFAGRPARRSLICYYLSISCILDPSLTVFPAILLSVA
jgi:hypothetical protein